MPTYHYKCPKTECAFRTTRIRAVDRANVLPPCPLCKATMARDPSGPSSRVVETLDNGVMSRRVERLADVERIMDERSRLKEERDP